MEDKCWKIELLVRMFVVDDEMIVRGDHIYIHGIGTYAFETLRVYPKQHGCMPSMMSVT